MPAVPHAIAGHSGYTEVTEVIPGGSAEAAPLFEADVLTVYICNGESLVSMSVFYERVQDNPHALTKRQG